MSDPIRRAQVRLAAQNGAVGALVDAETVEEAVPDLLRAVCENLGWTVGQFWYPAPGDRVLELMASWADPLADVDSFLAASRDATFDPGAGLPGRVWKDGSAAWIHDVLEDSDFPRAPDADRAGLHAAFAVPVPLDGGRTGVLEFYARRPTPPDPELLETMMAVGGYLGQFMRRRSAEAALRESEERFRTFASTVPDATFVIDAESRITYVNDAVHAIFGYSPEELIGEPLTRLMPERHRPRHMEGMRRFLETGERRVPWDGVEMEGLRRDGTEVPVEITYGTYEKDGRHYFTGIVRDITERRRSQSRLRFQARLLDAVAEAVIATDLDGRIVYWNAFAEELYGWSADEVMGRPVDEVTTAPPSRSEADQIMERLRQGRPWSGEFTVRDRHGRKFVALVNNSPIEDDDGRIIGVIGTSIEISDRKRAEEGQRFLAEAGRVLASSLDYQTTLRSVAGLAVPHLGDWCLIHADDRADPEAASRPVARVVPDEDDAQADAFEREAAAGSAAFISAALTAETALTGPSDTGPELLREERLRQFGIHSLLAVPLRARGTSFGVMTFAITGSERRYDETDAHLAEELARRAALAIDNARLYGEAQEANRAKADFLAVVSHELRTPLNAIAGYADLLTAGVAGDLNDGQRRQVERIKVGSGHLAHIIDEVLAYARVEAGRDELSLEQVDLMTLAREALVVLEPDAADKGLPLHLDGPADGLTLVTDPGKVRQVLVNLLSNAVKYTDEGEVRVTVSRDADGATIDVTDTGIGIEPADQKRIFEPFWQAESPNTRTTGGTGLGLSVNRRLLDLLGGGMELESRPGEGSTFTVRIPDRS